MKKNLFTSVSPFLLLVSCFLFLNSCYSQELLSKKGTPILPEKGDWSIGMDATPLLRYAGNLFNHTDNNNTTLDYVHNHPITLVGLYMRDPNTAWRVMARIGYHNNQEQEVTASTVNPNYPAVVNTATNTQQFFTLGFGVQKFRGKGRLRGIYGWEAGFNYGSNTTTISTPTDTVTFTGKISFSYAEALSDSNTIISRLKEIKAGNKFGLSVRGFLGAEYFFAPKISLSAEFGWSIAYSSTGEGQYTVDNWDAINHKLVTETTKFQGKTSNFDIDVDNFDGMINLHFYF